MNKKAIPQTFKGTRDISGDDMQFRLYVIGVIREVFELFGFEPLETPIIERKETLLGKYGEEAENLLFYLAAPHEDGGLRYDQTVPLARFAAKNWNTLNKPYRRYVIGPVFRAENPQAGRFRQFVQCDFDTLGSMSLSVDAEIVAINHMVLQRLGFTTQYAVNVNDRRLLNAMTHEMGFGEDSVMILRAWDKLDKQAPADVLDYLVEAFKDGPYTRKQIEQQYGIVTDKLLALRDLPAEDVIDGLRKIFVSDAVHDALDILSDLVLQVESLGVPSANYLVNPLLARGLGYYTGPIFETIVKEGGVGSITGGGRFDNLVEAMGGPAVPASGSSFGLDRLLVVMEQLGLRPAHSQTTVAFLPIFDPRNAGLTAATLSVAADLRSRGIPTEVYSGNQTSLGKQLSQAATKHIPFAVIIGPDEYADEVVTVRDLNSRTEERVALSFVADYLTDISD